MFDWLTQNPLTPLTVYLFHQVPCTHHATACGWRWDKKTEKRGAKWLQRETTHLSSEHKNRKDSVCLLTLKAWFLKEAVANMQRLKNSYMQRIQETSLHQWFSIHHCHSGFYWGHGKRKFKSTVPCAERRLQWRLTQLPFIASDKRLNHTLRCLKCLLVIRSRILLSVLSPADCIWSKPNDGVTAIGGAGWVNLPIRVAICQGSEPC